MFISLIMFSYWTEKKNGEKNINTSTYDLHQGALVIKTFDPVNDFDVLSAFFDATNNGMGWCDDTGWGINSDPGNWYGCDGLDGCVTCINLGSCFVQPNSCTGTGGACALGFGMGGNNLTGIFPDTLCLPLLEELRISDNEFLTGSIPILSCSQLLKCIILDNNDLIGSIPESMSDLHNLTNIRLQQNRLEGPIPADLPDSLMLLEQFIVNQNCLSGSVPDFTVNPDIQFVNISQNNFTFEDILLHYDSNSTIPTFLIDSQKFKYEDTCMFAAIGYPFTIDLEIDENVISNIYEWRKEDFFHDSTIVNELYFDNIMATDSGTYTCQITNSEIPSTGTGLETYLTLNSHNITLKPCDPGVLEINDTLCFYDTLHYEILEFGVDTAFHINNPSGYILLDDGKSTGDCDSIIVINLDFYNPTEVFITDTLCLGATFDIDTQTLDTFITQAGSHDIIAVEGSFISPCDSIIHLELYYADANTFGFADAGSDTLVCDQEILLEGNLPTNTMGMWQDNQIQIPLLNDSTSLAMNLSPGENFFLWSLTHKNCTIGYDTASLVVYYQPIFDLLDDTFEVVESTVLDDSISFDSLIDFIPSGDWVVELVSNVNHGSLTFGPNGIFQYQSPECFSGEDSFSYIFQTVNCDYPGLGTVLLKIKPKARIDDSIPDVITPNGDGYNDTFIIPGIYYGRSGYEENELIIFNQWGDIVYEQKDYHNDWDGKDLPGNNYYYLFRYGEELVRGNLIILK